MRRLLHISLAAALLVAALAEPVVALQTTHACCLKRAVVAAEKPSCHHHHAAPSASFTATLSSQSECPNRCCSLGTPRHTARPESAPTWAPALFFISAQVLEFQPLSQSELPAPSERAPPSRSSC